MTKQADKQKSWHMAGQLASELAALMLLLTLAAPGLESQLGR